MVTGGSQGIGAAICKMLASCGADVFINYYSNKEKAQEVAEEIKTQHASRKIILGF